MTTRLRRFISSEVASTAILRIGGVGCLFLLHLVLARVLDPASYGAANFAMSTASLLVLLVTLGLPTASLRLAAEYVEGRNWDQLKGVLRMTGAFTFALAVMASTLLFVATLTPVVTPTLRAPLRLVSVLLPILSLHVWRSRAARGLGQVKRAYIPEEVLIPVLTIGVLLLLPSPTSTQAVLAYAVAGAVALAPAMLWLIRGIPMEARATRPVYRTRTWFALALPMTLATGMQVILSKTDVLLLGMLSTMDQVGIYSPALKLAMLPALPLQIATAIIGPRLAAYHATNQVERHRATLRFGTLLSIIGTVPIVAPLIIAPTAFLSLFGPGYEGAGVLLRILAAGQLVNAVTGPLSMNFLMTNRQATLARIVTMWTIINAAADMVAIPQLGALGAAIVTASSVAGMNLHLLIVHRRTGGVLS